MTRDDIFEKIVEILNETFEIPKDQISPDSLLEDDLDLDSIDAVDLIVKLKKFTEKSIDPTVFKQVRTINDIVDALESLVAPSDS